MCDARGLAQQLLMLSIDAEIAATATYSVTSLFRVNSVVTKYMSAYGKLYGMDYLRATLGEPLRTICTENRSLEVS